MRGLMLCASKCAGIGGDVTPFLGMRLGRLWNELLHHVQKETRRTRCPMATRTLEWRRPIRPLSISRD
jgi:hypothetical protein